MVSNEEYENMSNKASRYHSLFVSSIATMVVYAYLRIVGGSNVANNVDQLKQIDEQTTQNYETVVKTFDLLLKNQRQMDSTYQYKIDSLENVIKKLRKEK